MTILIDTQRTNCFVAQVFCKHLADAGLCRLVPYQWKIYNDVAKLHTHVFDIDDYYVDGVKHQDTIYPPDHILPAYNIKDVEKLLPRGYLFTFSEDCHYEISLSNIYNLDSCIADRMPDAFAMLVLQALRVKIIDLKKANLILQQ